MLYEKYYSTCTIALRGRRSPASPGSAVHTTKRRTPKHRRRVVNAVPFLYRWNSPSKPVNPVSWNIGKNGLEFS